MKKEELIENARNLKKYQNIADSYSFNFFEIIIELYDLYVDEKLENDKLKEELEQINGQYKILVDDLDEHNIIYVDEPEFEENFINKNKIKEKIKEKEEKIRKLHPASDCVIIDDLENQINCYKELLEE